MEWVRKEIKVIDQPAAVNIELIGTCDIKAADVCVNIHIVVNGHKHLYKSYVRKRFGEYMPTSEDVLASYNDYINKTVDKFQAMSYSRFVTKVSLLDFK